MARQFTQGYLGLQTHGGTDRISYREIQVKDVAPADIPVNTVAPTVTGTGVTGPAADLQPRHVEHGGGHRRTSSSGTARTRSCRRNPRFRAPSATDYWNQTTPADPLYGTQNLTWTDSLLVGEGETYTPTAEDIGKVIHCAVNADNAGATVWKTAQAPEIGNGSAGGTVPATLSLTLGTPASFGAFTPGVAKTYEASTTANVISTAGDALLSVADPSRPPPATWSTARSRCRSRCRPARATPPTPARRTTTSAAAPRPLNLLTYGGPVSNDAVALQFSQQIDANDALRTGAYAKTLTFTLSTTTP